MTFEQIILLPISLSAIIYVTVIGLLIRVFREDKTTIHENLPQVSLLIAAKNEEKNIPSLFSGLKNLNYPENLLEIIIVDDGSTDNTLSLLRENSAQFRNMKIITSEGKLYPGKKGALDLAVHFSKYDVLAVTDADCLPNPDWLISLAPVIKNGADYVFGLISFSSSSGFKKGFFAFDNFNSQLISHLLIRLGISGSAGAGSMAFRKKSFYKLGGYKNVTATLSGDDDLMVQRARKENMIIKSVLLKNALVTTPSKDTFSEFINQRSRHVSASSYYNISAKIAYFLWHLANMYLSLTLFLSLFYPAFIYFYLGRLALVFGLYLVKGKMFGYKLPSPGFLIYPYMYDFFAIINWAKALLSEPKWK